MLNTAMIGAMTTPEMTKRDADLGWIAATAPDHPWRIAVMGATEGEAVERFREAVARWEAIPDGEKV